MIGKIRTFITVEPVLIDRLFVFIVMRDPSDKVTSSSYITTWKGLEDILSGISGRREIAYRRNSTFDIAIYRV